MRIAVLSAIIAMVAAASGMGQSENATIWSNLIKGKPDSGWVVQIPTASSDYFSCGYDVVATLNVESATVSKSMPIRGVGVSVADFGTTQTYPTVGVFRPNVGLDATGNTPDLSLPIATSSEAYAGGLGVFDYQDFDTSAQGTIPGGDATTLSVVQLPPGDSGLLGVGADSTTSSNHTSGFTTDGFATPSILATFLDFGMAIGQDNSTTNSCSPADRLPHGRLRCQRVTYFDVEAGDHLTTTLIGGDTLNLSFFGTRSGDKWRLYFATAPCSPAVAVGPVLSTIPDSDGDGTFLRINATWPSGFGGQTFRFSAVWGNGACSAPGVGFTNCVTIVTAQDLPYGQVDDGTVEAGFVVQIPSGSSDYFNNSFGPKPPGVNGVVGLTLAVQDFVTAIPAYPTTGVSNPNLGVDPSGNTPDISGAGLLALVSPFTFPSGTFATTSGQYVSHTVSVPGSAMTGSSIHGWLQFPPGDPGLLAIGVDTSDFPGPQGQTFFSLDGYTSPAVQFSIPIGNAGIIIKTN
jgi:hypothetical protein